MRPNSKLNEILFFSQLKSNGIKEPLKEYKFDSKRRWRFDYCFPDYKLAVEVEGGVWIQGRHNRASGFVKDIEKYNKATILGYKVIRVLPENLFKLETIEMIKEIIKNH